MLIDSTGLIPLLCGMIAWAFPMSIYEYLSSELQSDLSKLGTSALNAPKKLKI